MNGNSSRRLFITLTENRMSLLAFHFRRIWTNVPLEPPDPILDLAEAYRRDKDLKKVNLIGQTYRDDEGKPHVLPVVRKAEKLVQAMNLHKEYLPIVGTPEFCRLSTGLILGDNSEHVKNGLYATAQSLSGTGALRLAMDFIKLFYPFERTIYFTNPTCDNHHQIIRHALLQGKALRYLDWKNFTLDFKGLTEDISNLQNKSIVLLQACAHNPTGVEPTSDQWNELSALIKKKNHLAIFDLTHHGFSSGDFDRDVYGVRKFVKDGNDPIICQSYSINMGLYADRVGALTFLTKSKDEATKILSQLKNLIKGVYFSPPCGGSRIVTKILEDQTLRAEWIQESIGVVERIGGVRKALKAQLKKEGSSKNWDHITGQSGIFCYSGLTQAQVDKMAQEYHIYMRKDGGMSLAGLFTKNVEYVGRCMHLVTK